MTAYQPARRLTHQQAVRLPVRRLYIVTSEDIRAQDEQERFWRGIKNATLFMLALCLGVGAVVIVTPQIIAATAGMP